MRVAHIVPAANHSPWFADICAETVRRGHEVHAVIDSGPGNLSERLTALGISHSRVPMHFGKDFDLARPMLYLLALPFSAIRLARILRKERIEIAHSHIFVGNVIARAAKLFASFHHVAGAAAPRHLEAPITRWLDRRMWRLDDAIVAGCEYIAGLYRRAGASSERVHTIYYGPPAQRFDPSKTDRLAFRGELGIPTDAPVVGLVAHFYPPMRGSQAPPHTRGVDLKGHDHFLAAARIVARRFPEARFLLVGGGSNALGERYRQSLIEACRADGFDSRVFFPGHRYDIAEVLASFDVAVQCALTETLGGTIEALLMERPTVATAVGGMPEAVRHEETGLLVPPADDQALAAAIERLLANREEAAKFGRAGRAWMLERFTLDRTGADVTALYERLGRVW